MPYKPRKHHPTRFLGRKITKNEKMAKALGTTQVLKALQKLGVLPYYWNLFGRKYKIAEWNPWDYYYGWHPTRGPMCIDKEGKSPTRALSRRSARTPSTLTASSSLNYTLS